MIGLLTAVLCYDVGVAGYTEFPVVLHGNAFFANANRFHLQIKASILDSLGSLSHPHLAGSCFYVPLLPTLYIDHRSFEALSAVPR